NVKLYYVNDEINESGFIGLLMIKASKSSRGKQNLQIPCKPGDIVRARVVNNNNGITFLSMDRVEDGVIFTTCSACGGRVVRVGNGVKCVECGIVEKKKLAADFSKFSLKRL
ncbi:MAG: hypothetical protein RMJ31_05755, partial [Nitrososphaerota archaeon]|nr:hypothetical protein [Nitrososphaerales archaeon]MDW8045261.1 hypothetical protein [Nitrososphaerota archaeon]